MYFDTRPPAGMVTKAVVDAKGNVVTPSQPLYQDLFFPSLDFTTGTALSLGVAGSATATRSTVLTIDQDAHILLCGAMRVATDAATDQSLQAFVPVLVSLKMVASGRDLMSAAQHIENVFGTAQLPGVWARPKFLAAGSSVRATLTNLGATALNVRLSFAAFKIFLDS